MIFNSLELVYSITVTRDKEVSKMKRNGSWKENRIMCCRMLISRTGNMAGAFDVLSMRLDCKRC